MFYDALYTMTCDIMIVLRERRLSQYVPFFAKTTVEEKLFKFLDKLRKNLGNRLLIRRLLSLHKKEETAYVIYNSTEGELTVVGAVETRAQRLAVCLAHMAAYASSPESPLSLKQKIFKSFLSRSPIAKEPRFQEALDLIKESLT